MASITPTEEELPWIISVDDHVVEPANVWTDRLPAGLRERGPRIERLPAGELRLEGARYVERPAADFGRVFATEIVRAAQG